MRKPKQQFKSVWWSEIAQIFEIEDHPDVLRDFFIRSYMANEHNVQKLARYFKDIFTINNLKYHAIKLGIYRAAPTGGRTSDSAEYIRDQQIWLRFAESRHCSSNYHLAFANEVKRLQQEEHFSEHLARKRVSKEYHIGLSTLNQWIRNQRRNQEFQQILSQGNYNVGETYEEE